MLWIVITGGIFAFFTSAGIGANDAANAFATSVGSKALTLKQAVVLATIFETSGAILMGSHVTNTIRKGIADYQCFEETPELFAYGCMWVIFCVGAWLFLASYLEMPVSTTHSCVGGMIGMATLIRGSECVIWYKKLSTFPYIGGVSGIVLSWLFSPIFSGVIAMFLYVIVRAVVLRNPFEGKYINYMYPILVGLTVAINTFFIIYKGAKGLGLADTPLETSFAYALGIGFGSACITYPFVSMLKAYIEKKFQTSTPIDICINQEELNITSEKQYEQILSIHQNAETFDVRTEESFKYIQVFTAICDAFSHGANDVANAIGPFVAIYSIYKTNELSKKSDMNTDAYWILALGGVGIASGLILYGKKITRAIGDKLVKITPSRGSVIELASALVIIIGTHLKIPLSTTHCQVGATCGVGILESVKGINYHILLKTMLGWVLTCVVVALSSALFISQGVYAPSIHY